MNIEIQRKIQSWLQEPFDPETIAQVKALAEFSEKELEDSFYTDLSFGTGGLRGLMGVGPNRLNRYTIRKTTQGLANYLKKKCPSKGLSVVIGFDNRINSEEFAKEASNVLIKNGIDVFLFSSLRPTPFISFACRYRKANAGIMITASHNPKEYNGYKVYGEDGAQVVFPADKQILEEIGKLKDFSIQTAFHQGILHLPDQKTDPAYIKAIRPLQNFPKENRAFGKELSIVYTSLHGTGITLIPKALRDWGFSSLSFVKSQILIDGTFPSLKSPNPEDPESLEEGVHLLSTSKADLLLVTDPDADRVGVAVKHKGSPVILTGNEIGAICTEYLSQNHKKINTPGVITTIVSTDLIKSICKAHNIPCFTVLTGFKYIGEKIGVWEKSPSSPSFLFGAEESHGYLYGTHARDKDGIVSCCLLAEIALHLKRKGKTLIDFLHGIYEKYGVFKESIHSVDFPPGKEGIFALKRFMDHFRAVPPPSFSGYPVLSSEDFLDPEEKHLPCSDVLLFRLEGGFKLIIRPSGTEPKVKIYVSIQLSQNLDILYSLSLAEEKLKTFIRKIKGELSIH